MAFSSSCLPRKRTHTHTHTEADTPDPNYINGTLLSLTRHSVADLSVARSTRPPDHKNYVNATLVSLNGKSPTSLSPEPLGHQTTETAETQHCYHEPGGRTFCCRLNHSATTLRKPHEHKTALITEPGGPIFVCRLNHSATRPHKLHKHNTADTQYRWTHTIS